MSQRKQSISSKNVKPGTVQQYQQTNKPQRKHQFMRNQWQMGSSIWHQCCQMFCHPLQTFTKVYKECSIWMAHLWAQMRKKKKSKISWNMLKSRTVYWAGGIWAHLEPTSISVMMWQFWKLRVRLLDCDNHDNAHHLKGSWQTSGHPKVTCQNCLLDATAWPPFVEFKRNQWNCNAVAKAVKLLPIDRKESVCNQSLWDVSWTTSTKANTRSALLGHLQSDCRSCEGQKHKKVVEKNI